MEAEKDDKLPPQFSLGGNTRMKTSTPAPIETTTTTVPRPTAITVICIIGFIGGLFTIPLVFTDIARNIGAWYPPYLAFSAVVGFVCMVGLWKMRRWAVFTYTGFFILNQLVMLMMGVWNVFALLLPGIVIVIAFTYLSKMR
jgi:hypothetical protein